MTTLQVTAILTEDRTSYIGRVDCAALREQYGAAHYHIDCLVGVERWAIDEYYAPCTLRRGQLALCGSCGKAIRPRGLDQ